jgi:hypothetical protein
LAHYAFGSNAPYALLFLLERRAASRSTAYSRQERRPDAKVWLAPEIMIAESYGFKSRELSNILGVIVETRDLILKAWHDHFGNQRPL